MTRQGNAQDVPPRVMDLLRIFLAASSRGEEATLILETRKSVIFAKFRSVESIAGVPAAPTNIPVRKSKKNPARARRSRLQLEKFMERKVDEKKQAESSHTTRTTASSPTNKLIIKLDKEESMQDRSMGEDLTSPIPQVDGTGSNISDPVKYTFVSDYHQEDIRYCLEELFPPGSVTLLVSCVGPRTRESADQNCIVTVRKTAGQDTSWPEMKEDQKVVFKELAILK
jgi:hypothetical protein